MNEIKAFVTDIDGTLLEEGNAIEPVLMFALQVYSQKGIGVTFNTARPYFRAIQDFPIELSSIPNITNLGTELRSPLGDLLKVRYLPPDAIKAFADLCGQQSPEAILYYHDGELSPRIFSNYPKVLEKYVQRYGKYGIDAYHDKTAFLHVMTQSQVSMALAKTEDSRRFDLLTQVSSLATADTTYADSYTITPLGVDKGSGIDDLGNYLGLVSTQRQILSAGDSESDIGMFKKTVGISVGNTELIEARHFVDNRIQFAQLLFKLINL